MFPRAILVESVVHRIAMGSDFSLIISVYPYLLPFYSYLIFTSAVRKLTGCRFEYPNVMFILLLYFFISVSYSSDDDLISPEYDAV